MVFLRRWMATALVMGVAAGCMATVPAPKFVYFDSGMDKPRSDDEAMQVGQAVSVLQHERRLRAAIIGYASSEGDVAQNKRLSLRRADRVRDMIGRNGIAPERLTLAARGVENPAASNDTEEGRAKNRRVEVFFYDPSRGGLQVQYGVKIEVQER